MSDLFQDDNPQYVQVLVTAPVDKAYTYAVPDGLTVDAGDIVRVPLGPRKIYGAVWGIEGSHVRNIKQIDGVVERLTLPGRMRDFVDWVADYTMTPRGMVLKMVLSSKEALDGVKSESVYALQDGEVSRNPKQKLTFKQQSIVDALQSKNMMSLKALSANASVSSGVVKTLEKKGIIQKLEIKPAAPCVNPDVDFGQFKLTQSQAEAVHSLNKEGGFNVSLLDGVTGAGKTEVYFESVARAIESGKQVLIMLPEIALSNAFLSRFKKRFGCNPALWHSHVSAKQRAITWQGVLSGETRVIIGARSALFLPFLDLGYIIVDEEHDPAYKQEEQGLYHARDMAIVRAKMANCPITLVSATPSLETMHNVWQGRYNHVQLPARFGGAQLPDMHIVDMRTEQKNAQSFISETLRNAIEVTLEDKKQALLFLNRRGYAPLTLCRHCGHRIECPRCTAWLVEHRFGKKLQCHHCGFDAKTPDICPECEERDTLTACGPGVERIREEAKALFPDARIVVLASDILNDPNELRIVLNDIQNGAYDIIIGTQIIAKGHHFPLLTCVGVIDADLGLSGGELHASERVYQLLSQVAGRAGREKDKGHVYLQTFVPDHSIMQALASGDRDTFLRAELSQREITNMPPYSRLAGIIVQGKNENQVIDIARALGQSAPQNDRIRTLGPAPAPMLKLRGNYRYRLLVCADKTVKIQTTLHAWVSAIKKPSTVRIIIDIDPQSFV